MKEICPKDQSFRVYKGTVLQKEGISPERFV
jgi:hypothetical protein